MNSYLWIRRAKGPVILITVGVTALLDQWHILSFGRSWPLYLLVLGVMQLAERAALSQAQNPPLPYGAPQPPYGTPQPPYGTPPQPYGAQQQYPPPAPPATSLTITPSPFDRLDQEDK
jgi:hypothetical protein